LKKQGKHANIWSRGIDSYKTQQQNLNSNRKLWDKGGYQRKIANKKTTNIVIEHHHAAKKKESRR